MASEKIERWIYLALLAFLLASSTVPNYAIFFVAIIVAVVSARLALASGDARLPQAIGAIGCSMLAFFIVLPFSANIYASLRQYILIINYLVAFAIPIVFVRTEQDIIRVALVADICLIGFGVLIALPQELLQTPLMEKVAVFRTAFLSDAGAILVLAGNLVNLFPIFLVLSLKPSRWPVKGAFIAGLAAVFYLCWKMGTWGHLVPITAMLLVWLGLAGRREVGQVRPAALVFVGGLLLAAGVILAKDGYYLKLGQWLSQVYGDPRLWAIFVQHPFLGTGLDTFSHFYYGYDNTGKISHALGAMPSSYINLLLETGLVGLVGYLAMLGYLVLDNYRAWTKTAGVWPLAALLLLTGYLLATALFHYFVIPAVMHIFYFVLGLAYVSRNNGTPADGDKERG
ncbi:MAG: hypothetical protein P4N59_04285 [Negativicutes bacterium]|nr:hypothetical protein [Negativicutes bacterium]